RAAARRAAVRVGGRVGGADSARCGEDEHRHEAAMSGEADEGKGKAKEPTERASAKPGDGEREREAAIVDKPEADKGKRKRGPSRAGFDVPSSTVHPHADELETLTMARLYAAEGQLDRALEIYE